MLDFLKKKKEAVGKSLDPTGLEGALRGLRGPGKKKKAVSTAEKKRRAKVRKKNRKKK